MSAHSGIATITLFKDFYNVGKIMGKTGVWMPLYPDLAKLASDPKRLMAMARAMAKVASPWKPDVIVGPAVRGIVYGLPVALVLKKPFLFLRAEQKHVHLKKTLEGEYHKGQRVVVVDDGLATSDTKKYTVQALQKAGLKVVGVVVFLDAWQGTTSKLLQRRRAWLTRQPFPIKVIVGWDECIKVAIEKKFIGRDFGTLMISYLRDPYAWLKDARNWQRVKELAPHEKNVLLHASFKDISV